MPQQSPSIEIYRVGDLKVDAGRRVVSRDDATIPLPKLSFDLGNADGTLQQIVATQQNFGRLIVRGLDFSLNLSWPTSLGHLQIGALGTYLARRDKQSFDGSELVHEAGEFDTDLLQAFPHWRALAHMGWQAGPWQVSYAVQYIGGLTEDVFLDDGIYRHDIPAVTYHDIECAYEFKGGSRLRLGATNLTDKDPPFVNSNTAANTDVATYRPLGRTYFAEVRFRLN